MGTKPVELLSTDAFHLLKVFDFSKWSTCRPVIDHPLRQLGADTGQALQIRCGGVVEIDLPRRLAMNRTQAARRLPAGTSARRPPVVAWPRVTLPYMS